MDIYVYSYPLWLLQTRNYATLYTFSTIERKREKREKKREEREKEGREGKEREIEGKEREERGKREK